MHVRITGPAARDLGEISTHIARDNPAAALRMLDRLHRAVRRLAAHPRSGHARPDLGLQSGVRFVTVAPYLVVYVSIGRRIEIIRVLHAARNVTRTLDEDDGSDE